VLSLTHAIISAPFVFVTQVARHRSANAICSQLPATFPFRAPRSDTGAGMLAEFPVIGYALDSQCKSVSSMPAITCF
jgi:hypothetical protein